MVRSLLPKMFVLAAVAAGALSACGVDPYGVQYDQYGNPISPYGSSAYGSTYGSSGSSYSSSTSYGSSYGSSYDSSPYSSSYGSSSYGSSYGSSYDSSYSSYGSGYGSPVPSMAPTLPPVVIATEASALNTYVKDTKKNGLLGLRGITANVDVSNPTNRTLTGTLRVTFTSNGHESGNQQTRKVTLRPLEEQVLTFTASGVTLNGAEATIETEQVTSTQSSVADRTP